MVVRYRASITVVGDPRRRGEGIPDRQPTAIFGDRALDLIGGGGGSPQEVGRECGGESLDICRTRLCGFIRLCVALAPQSDPGIRLTVKLRSEPTDVIGR
jgi:hypothetical protein